MIKQTFNIYEFEKAYKVDDGTFFSDVAIVDNELMNDIAENWNYEEGQIAVTGVLFQDVITIFIAEKEDDEDFKREVVDFLIKISSQTKLYAFNNKMEMGNFKGNLDYEVKINEIKPFRAKGWNKDKFFHTLIDDKVIKNIAISDVFDGDGAKCITSWKKYIKTGEEGNLSDIISHNINCLLKECIILKNRNYFFDNYECDKNNFMLRKNNK